MTREHTLTNDCWCGPTVEPAPARHPAPFSEGDRVQVKPEHDETLQFLGVRTNPGTVLHVDDEYVLVGLDDEHGVEAGGQSVPYPATELTWIASR